MNDRIDLIHELVSSAAAAVPDRQAIICADGSSVTFAFFDSQVGSVASWTAQRTRRGDRVAIIADNGAAYARLYYGVPRSGRILVLINQRLSPAEQITQLALAEPTILVGDARYLDALPEIAEHLPSVEHVVAFDDPEWQRAEHQPAGPTEVVAPDDPAWLLFTSGSTGPAKGVLHTHRSITTAVRGTVAGRSVRSGGVYLLPFPMCHVAGYNMLVHHAAQSTVLPVAAFRPDAFAEAVNAFGVTSCSLAPTMLHGLLAHLEDTGVELPTLRDIAYGSAAIPADLLRRALARLDVDFHQGYGMTETGGNITFLGGPTTARGRTVTRRSWPVRAGHTTRCRSGSPPRRTVSVKSWSAVHKSPPATGRTTHRRRSTAGFTPATSAASTTGGWWCSTASRTSSSPAARTYRHARSRTCCRAILTSIGWRWLVCPTSTGARRSARSSSPAPASARRRRRWPPTCVRGSPRSSAHGTSSSSTRFR